MKRGLAILHFLFGLLLFGAGVMVLDDYWKTPAYFLLASGGLILAVGYGLYREDPRFRWLPLIVAVVASVIAVFLLAGSLVWPEDAGSVIILSLGAFALVEILAWGFLRKSSINGKG